ncbi:MAG: putative lipid II flippase FtsW [Solirubrobacterales bacterium]|nr:putative lipid II flippase FtsW [Solirubrobacterales bacterium]
MRPEGRGRQAPVEYQLLLTATLCLLALGAVMVFSASSATGVLNETGGGGFQYLKKIVIFGAIGLLVMRFASIKGARVTRALTPVMVGVSLFLLACVLVPGVGQTVNGSQRWVGSGVLTFQPSELAKVSLILYGAHLLAARPKMTRSLRDLGPYLLIVALAMLMVVMQPDLGTAMTTTFAVGALLLVAGVRPGTLAPVAAIGAVAIVGVIAANPYQQDRLTGFLNPGADVEGAGYQSQQAQIALGSGGTMGVGLGESVQKASYLPEAHTDMISAVLGEETGLAGMVILIGLLSMFGYAGFRAAHRARDRYGKLLAAGLTTLIMVQATINLFAVLGLAPLTGVPLPFVSYGGTSLIVTLASAGLIMNVARRQSPASAKASRPAARPAARGGERLRTVQGTGARWSEAKPSTGAETRRRGTAGSTSRDSGRRHGGPRRAGDSRRGRAAR